MKQNMGVDGICTDYPERVHAANEKFRPQQQLQQESQPGPAVMQDGANAPRLAYSSTADTADPAVPPDRVNTNTNAPVYTSAVPAGRDTSTLSSSSTPVQNEDAGNVPSSSDDNNSVKSAGKSVSVPIPAVLEAPCGMDTMALGGWYERPAAHHQHGHRHRKNRVTNEEAEEVEVAVAEDVEEDEEECKGVTQYSHQQRLFIALYGDLSGVRDSSGVVRGNKCRFFFLFCIYGYI